jgi:tetratricopeptide (TPR) repeat protein
MALQNKANGVPTKRANRETGFIVRHLCFLILVISLAAVNSHGQTGRSAEDYLNSATAHARNREMDAALNDLNRAIDLNPDLAPAFLLRGNLRERKKDVDGAVSDYNRAIELAPDASGMEVGYNNRSIIRLSKGDLTGARQDINNAIRLNPRIAAFYNQRAIVRLQEGDQDGAALDYEKALELNPAMTSAYYGRGSYRLRKGELDEAVADYNSAIELRPDYPNAYVYRGMARGLKGDLEGAAFDIRRGFTLDASVISDQGRSNFTSPFKDLTQFITSNPSNAKAYTLRGIFRLLQGNAAESEQDFRKSLGLEPRLKDEIDNINRELSRSINRSNLLR